MTVPGTHTKRGRCESTPGTTLVTTRWQTAPGLVSVPVPTCTPGYCFACAALSPRCLLDTVKGIVGKKLSRLSHSWRGDIDEGKQVKDTASVPTSWF